jgi:hypothetical protein
MTEDLIDRIDPIDNEVSKVNRVNKVQEAAVAPKAWNPEKPPVCTGRALVVQPVLMYRVAQKRPATPTG